MYNGIFFIAEAGVNHNGNIDLAHKLIDIAKEAGADAVKFQTFKAEGVVTKYGKMAEYQKNNIGKEESQIEMIKKFELKFEDFLKLKNYCDKIGIMFLSTPHSGKDSIDYLKSIGMKYFKFGSGDITNIPALKHAAKYGIPMILGTGMCNMDDIKLAIKSIKEEGNSNITVLHCTTNYPCPFDQVNLRAMLTIQKELEPDIVVGYSDHTLGWKVPLMSAFYGAKVIEKHFTIDKNMEGPDHIASSSPEELKDIIRKIREFEKNKFSEEELKTLIGDDYELIMGSYEKKPNDIEKQNIIIARKSIVTTKLLKKGTVISEDDIAIKRPGGGLEPKYFFDLIGKKINKDLKEEVQISLKDIT